MTIESQLVKRSAKIESNSESINFSYQEWLNDLYMRIGKASIASLFIQENEHYLPVASMPEESVISTDLVAVAEKVQQDQSGVVLPQDNSDQGSSSYLLGYPVSVENEVKAIVLFGLLVENKQQLKDIMLLIEQHVISLRTVFINQNLMLDHMQTDITNNSIDLFAKVLSEPRFDAAVMGFITGLATYLGCQRVSFGINKSSSIKVLHFSHSAKITKRMNIIRLLEEGMNEALDQKRVVAYPPLSNSETNTVCVAHQQLADKDEIADALLSIPFYDHNNEPYAVVTLERDTPFDEKEASNIESLVSLSSAALYEKKQNDRWIGFKVASSFKEQFSRLFGEGYFGRKLILILLVITFIVMMTATGAYRLTAKAIILATEERSIVSPFDGYIDTADYRIGDKVKKGDILVQLDDKDYRLDKIRIASQVAQLKKQKERSIARRNKASINIFDSQIEESVINQKLAQMKLDRSTIKSPMDGIIVSGDLSQRLGDSVDKGEVLFDIVPVGDYKLSLNIPENRVKDIRIGLSGDLYLPALAKQKFPFKIVKILPNIVTEGEVAHFIAEAQFTDHVDDLLLGMKGVGKIEIDNRLLISIWTREIRDLVRIYWWRWWG